MSNSSQRYNNLMRKIEGMKESSLPPYKINNYRSLERLPPNIVREKLANKTNLPYGLSSGNQPVYNSPQRGGAIRMPSEYFGNNSHRYFAPGSKELNSPAYQRPTSRGTIFNDGTAGPVLRTQYGRGHTKHTMKGGNRKNNRNNNNNQKGGNCRKQQGGNRRSTRHHTNPFPLSTNLNNKNNKN